MINEKLIKISPKDKKIIEELLQLKRLSTAQSEEVGRMLNKYFYKNLTYCHSCASAMRKYHRKLQQCYNIIQNDIEVTYDDLNKSEQLTNTQNTEIDLDIFKLDVSGANDFADGAFNIDEREINMLYTKEDKQRIADQLLTLNMNELRSKYPTIKSTSKKHFVDQLLSEQSIEEITTKLN